MTNAATFKGKFFLHSGRTHYQHGKVVNQIGEVLLLRNTTHADPLCSLPLMAIHINSVLESFGNDDSPSCEWAFFNSESDLRSYLDWVERPEETTRPKIVSIAK